MLLACALLAFGCGRNPERASEETRAPKAAEDARAVAPDVVLADLDGKTLRLSDHRGKVVLVGFWATWCGPCRREVPSLKALEAAYASRGLVILGLSVDRGGEDLVRDFVREHGVTWQNAVADEAAIDAFGSVAVIPTTFIVDKDGKIAHRFTGLQSEAKLQAAIEPLL